MKAESHASASKVADTTALEKHKGKYKKGGPIKFKMNVVMKSIEITLNKEGDVLAEFGVYNGSVSLAVYERTMQAKGILLPHSFIFSFL